MRQQFLRPAILWNDAVAKSALTGKTGARSRAITKPSMMPVYALGESRCATPRTGQPVNEQKVLFAEDFLRLNDGRSLLAMCQICAEHDVAGRGEKARLERRYVTLSFNRQRIAALLKVVTLNVAAGGSRFCA